ncbi:hypothetical protein [Novosphingobium clariflavum]|uniref:Uncharacterized protein n=1 Tax=Novosphingobium clariflavum TaxID=2029884 RepID=A0ABV6S2F4_9SPHN|nr:hypothetical protein [Novosphingobium clariflavum]
MCHCGIELDWLPSVIAWLDKWQTLITGFMALGAAFVALQPVRKQLALMRAQNNVMVRETIGHMITQLDQHRASLDEITGKTISEISSSLWHFEQYGPKGIDEWASATHSSFNTVQEGLKALFITAHDVAAVESQKEHLLAVSAELSSCLWDIVAPVYAVMWPEENTWTDEESKAADVRAVEAQKELEDRNAAVSLAIRQLREAYANQRAVLVRQLRVIDDGLLNGVALKET